MIQTLYLGIGIEEEEKIKMESVQLEHIVKEVCFKQVLFTLCKLALTNHTDQRLCCDVWFLGICRTCRKGLIEKKNRILSQFCPNSPLTIFFFLFFPNLFFFKFNISIWDQFVCTIKDGISYSWVITICLEW